MVSNDRNFKGNFAEGNRRKTVVSRKDILLRLNAHVNVNGHILGVVAGSGMTAKYALMGGADLILALSAGKYRMMGRPSYGGYLCYKNSNEMVMNLGMEELIPQFSDAPIIFGLFASDPTIHVYDYVKKIKNSGFSGVVNFPTVALIDGQFREALEEDKISYDKEVEAIQIAHFMDLFTVAFVTNTEEAEKMLEAGADVICVHLGLTKGGLSGAKPSLTMHDARMRAEKVFEVCEKIRGKDVIKMIYAGPANTPIDVKYMYENTRCQGYIGGSTFDRIPIERAVINTTKAFKTKGSFEENDPLLKAIDGNLDSGDYAAYVKNFINEHYMQDVQLKDLALVIHVSSTYLSIKFKKEMGCSFKEYLVSVRMNKACQLMKTNKSCKGIAHAVGYSDYAQFSKMFKKFTGYTPTMYKKMENEKK